ncbi:E3 ubiquitin-protein ligase RMA1H1-like isoform X2 [Neltuma alba]|nr:E3 ubiquitin-protein ligase RMA1H1-like isoform X2 [Prosopis alba]
MAFGHYLSQGWKPNPSDDENSMNGCFDCNICLDFAREPVVTHCGHLYCWPCIYKWLHLQTETLTSDEHPQCPVCKACISSTTIIPLYGRGQASLAQSERHDEKESDLDISIPPRPPAASVEAPLPSSSPHNTYQNQHSATSLNLENASSSPRVVNVGATLMPGFHHLLHGMFGEMVYARVFGNPENIYAYRNSYHVLGPNSPRLRRQEMQADKSLKRVSIFLCCCLVLCLLVF